MSKLYTESNEIYGVTISSDGAAIKYIDPTEGPKEIPDITNNANAFLQVNSDASNIQWTDLSGGGTSIPINRIEFGIGGPSAPTITFQGDTDTGIYSQNANEITFVSNAVQRLKVDNNSVDVGTAINNLNFVVNGNSSATRFRAGDGVIGTPSYSFTTGNGQDCGMYYDAPSGNDRINFAVNGSNILQLGLSTGVSNMNNKLLLNSGTTTNPAIAMNTTAFNTGFSGDTSNNLYTLTAGSINTTHTSNSFDVGRTISNNLAMKTLNANGPSNFNTFTPTYSSIINTQITGNRTDGNWYGIDYNPTTGVYIIGSNGTGVGVTRIAVSGSNNLTSWTTYNDATLAYGNIRHVAYGSTPNIWVIGSNSSVQRNFYYSTNTTSWTLVSDTGVNSHFATARAYSKLKWINSQFVGLSTGSNVAFSTDGINWTLRQINATSYSLQDIVYSSELRMYVITTTTSAVLYFNDTAGTGITASTTFTAQTSNVYASSAIGWSPKLSTFIIQNTSVNTQWASSSDGINWRTFTTTALNQNNGRIEWVPDFGGFFIGCQAATNANCIFSRDGITWTQVNLTISGQSRGFYYNSSQKVFVFGLDANLTFKNASTDFSTYIDSDNIYNTFNSNIRFSDVIEYINQSITTVSGLNHFTLSQFNRPEVVFDTTSTNANIYLQGSSFNGRVGCKFKFIKSNSNNNVRIHGFETTTLISPTGNVSSFNAQSSPAVYAIIPAGYFGSFELTRISDAVNGIWVVDNVDVYDSSGTHRDISNLSVAGNLTIDGTISLTGGVDFVGNPRLSSTELRFVNVIDADINVPHFIGAYSGKTTPSGQVNVVTLKNLGVNGVGKTFYWFRSTGDVVNECRFTNDSGQDAYVFYWSTSNNREEFILVPNGVDYITHAASTNYSFSWFKFTYMEVANFRRWIVKEIGSGWE